jgi:hypothetical protein
MASKPDIGKISQRASTMAVSRDSGVKGGEMSLSKALLNRFKFKSGNRGE